MLSLRVFCLYLLCCGLIVADDDDARPSTLVAPDALQWSEDKQQRSGIQTQVLQASSYQPEFMVYGKALSSEPLLNLRLRYLTAQNQQSSQQATTEQIAKNQQRQHVLFIEGVSPKRLLEEQQAQWQSHKALLNAQQVQTQMIRQEALLIWGKTLSEGLLQTPSPWATLLDGRNTLLQMTIPQQKGLLKQQTIMVSATGQRQHAQRAQLISIAPQNHSGIAGNSYFFSVPSTDIHPGMNVNAWLVDTLPQKQGVIIPKSALIWLIDQSLVYVKVNATHFEQRIIHHYQAISQGYFIQQDLLPGDEVVILGAQQLLSNELKQGIPNEDD